MDRIVRRTPQVRNIAVTSPIVFAPNVTLSQFKSWRSDYGIYTQFMECLLR